MDPQAEQLYEQLAAEVRALERRIAAVESAISLPENPPPLLESPMPAAANVAPSRLLPEIGRVLLGVAGAYLLRAFTEGGYWPPLAGVAAGLVYAAAWLISSARLPATDRFASAARAATAALVTAPLLWEATLRFHALPTSITALLLALFVLLGFAVAWPKDLQGVTWITTAAAIGATIALIVATRDVVPFTVAVLAIAVAFECAAFRDHWLEMRWFVAVGADACVAILAYLAAYRFENSGYQPIPPILVLAIAATLSAIYLASTVARTLARHLEVCWFEISQVALALAIFLSCAVHARGAGAFTAAALCAGGAVICYVVAFSVVHHRNFYAYSSFSIALMVTGLSMLLSGIVLAGVLAVLAVAGAWSGQRTGHLTLKMHGAIYLGAATAAAWPLPPASALLLVAASLACYAAFWSTAAGRWLDDIPAIADLAIACGAVVALIPLAAGRTVTLSAIAILLAWFQHPGMRRLVYPLMAAIAMKLLAVDFQQGQHWMLFLSLLAYGTALIVVPRLARR